MNPIDGAISDSGPSHIRLKFPVSENTIWRSRHGHVILRLLQTYRRQGSELRFTMSGWSDPNECIFSWLFFIAFMGLGVLISLPIRPKFLFLITSPTWLCVYLVVLARNYKKKIPIPAFGRMVEYEKRPNFYILLYVMLLFMGLFEALCLFVVQGSRSLM